MIKSSIFMAFSKVKEEGEEFEIYDEFFTCEEDEVHNYSHTIELKNH